MWIDPPEVLIDVGRFEVKVAGNFPSAVYPTVRMSM